MTEDKDLSLVERLRDNDRTSAMREIMLRAPLGHSRAKHLAGECAVERLKHPQGTVPALANSLMVISYLNSKAHEAQTLAEISNTLHLTKSHCLSILRTLVYFEWLAFDNRHKTYRLLPSALSDLSSLMTSPLLEVVRSCLIDLVNEVDIPCVLSQPLTDGSFVVIDTFRSRNYSEAFFPVGHRILRGAPAHTRSLLAWAGEDKVEKYLADGTPSKFTRFTPSTVGQFKKALSMTRKRGYALSVNEFSQGMTAVGVPIFDRHGEVAYIASFSYLSDVPHFNEEQISAALRAAAEKIHRQAFSNPPKIFGDHNKA